MIMLLTGIVAYAVLVRRSAETLILLLIPTFAVWVLPSGLKEFFVSRVGGSYVYPNDILIVGFALLLLFSPTSRAKESTAVVWSYAAFLAINVLLLSYRCFTTGLETAYLRQSMIGVLWLSLAFLRLDVQSLSSKGLGWSFTAHNLLVLTGAVAIALRPDLNDPKSDLASFLGFSSDSLEEGGFILVSALAAVMCLVSVWYFLFVEYRGLLSPFVVLPVALVGASAHRIDYVALAVLLVVYFIKRRSFTVRQRHPVATAVLAVGYVSVLVVGIQKVGADVITDYVIPYLQRAASLFEGTQQGTVSERVEQYQYFFESYLHLHDPIRYLFGEGYLPVVVRDDYYQFVQPHNFLIFTFVNAGIVGVLFYTIFAGSIVLRNLRTPIILPFALLMITQLTDAAFIHYPISAYFGFLLALMRPSPGQVRRLRLARQEVLTSPLQPIPKVGQVLGH